MTLPGEQSAGTDKEDNMAISFFAERGLFHLTNGKFSYYVQIHPSGILLNPYFGAYIEDIDPEQMGRIGGEDWFSHYYCHTDGREKEYEGLYFNASPMLFPSAGGADVRPSAMEIRGARNNKLDMRYVSHRIYRGKPKLSGLPYVRDDAGEAETLEIVLREHVKDIKAVLSLSVLPEYNAVIRNTEFINKTGKPLRLGTVTELRASTTPTRIDRSDRRRTVKLFANPAPGSTPGDLAEAAEKTIAPELPPGKAR